jgi:hypothetical protein
LKLTGLDPRVKAGVVPLEPLSERVGSSFLWLINYEDLLDSRVYSSLGRRAIS